MYFWRTTSQQEIDYIEVLDDQIKAFEFKRNTKRKFKFPKSFLESYHLEK